MYPMVSRNSERPRSKATRRTEEKGKDELEQRVLVLFPASGDQGECLVDGK